MSDEHNPFYCSVYGHGSVRTPNMERLAEKGVVFENAYCPSPLCVPSRSAFMAGKRVHEMQVYSNCFVNLNTDHLSYGAALDKQGIHAAYVGKTHVYDDWRNLGFSEMILPSEHPSPGDMEHRRNPLGIREGAVKRADEFGPNENPWEMDPEYMGAAVNWLRTTAPSLGKPWVLCVNLVKPHFPHWTDRELWDMYAYDGDLPKYGVDCETARHPFAVSLREYFLTHLFSEEQIRGLRRGYFACVTFVDRQLGRIMDALDETGQLDKTNVIYTSDHGEMLGKFGMWWKCSLYEDSVRIPLIASGPDFRSGTRVKTPVDLHDLQAAIYAAFGAERPKNWIGEPLQNISIDDPKRTVFAEYHAHGTRTSAFMIRKGRWKFLYNVAQPNQLFDIDTDPDELKNLIDACPDIAGDLEKELRRICSPEVENDRAEEFINRQLAAADKAAEGTH